MKQLCLLFVVIFCFPHTCFAAQGDKVTDEVKAVWQIAATSGAMSNLLTKMDGVPDAYQATQNQDEWTTWLRLEMGQSGSLNKIFPLVTYTTILSKIIGYNYGDARIHEDYDAPSCSLSGSDIECDEDTQDPARDVVCYSWNFVDFTEVAAGSLAAGTWTFTGLAASTNHVCTFSSSFAAFPTTYMVTPAP